MGAGLAFGPDHAQKDARWLSVDGIKGDPGGTEDEGSSLPKGPSDRSVWDGHPFSNAGTLELLSVSKLTEDQSLVTVSSRAQEPSQLCEDCVFGLKGTSMTGNGDAVDGKDLAQEHQSNNFAEAEG